MALTKYTRSQEQCEYVVEPCSLLSYWSSKLHKILGSTQKQMAIHDRELETNLLWPICKKKVTILSSFRHGNWH